MSGNFVRERQRIVYIYNIHVYYRDLKIYDAIPRRRVVKTKQILIEDNNYE